MRLALNLLFVLLLGIATVYYFEAVDRLVFMVQCMSYDVPVSYLWECAVDFSENFGPSESTIPVAGVLGWMLVYGLLRIVRRIRN